MGQAFSCCAAQTETDDILLDPTGASSAVKALGTALRSEEAQKELRALFNTLDTDKDGKVTSKEWGGKVKQNQAVLQKFFGGSTTAQVARVFKEIDLDDDKKLTWEEFVAAVDKRSEELAGQPLSPPRARSF